MKQRSVKAVAAAAVIAVVGVSALALVGSTGSTTGSSPDNGLLVDAGRAPLVPDIAAASDWINTPALSRESLMGKVVWVDFWDASCINCRRTFPALRKLYDTYAPSGLVVVGVHTPEFDFEKPAAYVSDAARRLGVIWPVANDPLHAVWNSFGNQYWPAQYLVDRSGKVRFAHAGEGDDNKLEAAVRELLGGTLPAPVAGAPATPPGGPSTTPERYLGAQRGAETIASGAVAPGSTVTRNDPRPAPMDLVSLRGRFSGADQDLTALPGSSVALTFQAAEVYAILKPASGSVTVEVQLNGKPIPSALRGPDLRLDGSRTVVDVTRDDLWHLLSGGPTSGVLTLLPMGAPMRVFTFTFG